MGITGAWWITRRAQPTEEEAWADLVDELADRLMVYRPVKLLMSSGISSPMTWGIWRPVILLPIDADDWSHERRRYVLLHELAHIKRWDTLTQFAAQMGCALHWFNPLSWTGLQRLRIEQEKACDDLVLVHGMKASEYARHLLEIARSLKMSWVSPLNTISMAKPSQLEGRVVDILDPRKKKRTVNRLNAVLTCILALSVMLPICALSPWQEVAPNNASEDFISAQIAPLTTRTIGREEPVLATVDEANPVISWETESNPAARPGEALKVAKLKRAIAGLRSDSEGITPVLADTSEKQRRARLAALKALRKALSDENADVRRHAAMTLGDMEDQGSIDALIQLLKTDPDADVRRYAVAALCEMSSPKAVDAYLIALNDENRDVRRYAVMALADHEGEKAFNALIKVLDDTDVDIRRTALMGIAEYDDPRVMDLLIKKLDDENSDIRRAALMGIGEHDDPRVTDILVEKLDDENRDIRKAALMGLVDREDRESLPIFIKLLQNDQDADIRKFAAMALGEIGDIEAVEALTLALDDKNAEVRRHAAMALSELDYGDEDDWDTYEEENERDEDNDEWGEGSWDDEEWEESDWEGAEEFGLAMAQLGASAGEFGLAVGEMSLNLTSGVLAELATELENISFENDLASLEHDLFITEIELSEKIHELKSLQLALEQEWSEEAYSSILDAIGELEPVIRVNPGLCKKTVSIFSKHGKKIRLETGKELECEDRK